MRPFDPDLVRSEPAVRRPLAVLGLLGVLKGVLAILQAFAVSALVVAVVGEHPLVIPSLAVLTVFGVRAAVSGAVERVAAWAGSTMGSVLRRQAIVRWMSASSDSRPSETVMLSRATHGAQAVEPYVARYLPALVGAAVVPPIALAALVWVDWVSALIVLFTVPLLPLFAALIGAHTRDQTAARWRETDRLTGHFLDVMRGLPTLVNYQRAEHQVGVVRAVGGRLRSATVRTLRTAFLSSAALELLATISVAIVAVAVGLRLVHGEMSLGVGLLAILLAPEAYWPIRRVGQEFHAAADGAQAIADLQEETATSEHVMTADSVGAHDVEYRYPGTERPVLRHFDFAAGRGLTAIVGSSGAGKTTALDLLTGLRTPTSGTVERPTAVHYVTQRPFLVPGTLADNLRLGADLPPGIDWLPEPLRRLPAGLETPVGDDGFGLSAGQRALLALTRARLSGAPVVVLDEPTAHVDPQMRAASEAVIRDLAQERTVIVATHSASLIALADQVVRLDTSAPAVGRGRDGGVATWVHRGGRASDVRGRAGRGSGGGSDSLDHRGAASSVWRPSRGVLGAAGLGALASTCGVALTATSGWLIVQADARPPVLTLMVAIVCVRAFGIGRPVLRYAERLRSHDAALGDLVERRAVLYTRLIPLTPARLGRRRRADLLTGAVADLDDEVDVQVRAIVPLLGAALTALIAVVVVAALHPSSGLVLAAVVACLAGVAWWGYLLEAGAQQCSLQSRAAVNDSAQLIVTNLPGVRAISVGEQLLTRLDAAAASAVRAAVRQSRGRAVGMALNAAVAGLGVVLTGTVAQSALDHGTVSAPVAALLVLGPLALTDVLGDLPDAVGSAARGVQARHRLDDLTAQAPAVVDPGGDEPIGMARPTIRLDRVGASWTGEHADLNVEALDVGPGERISVTGPNGSGKSTLLAVLARHLDATTGDYDFAGRDVRDQSVQAIRSRIAVVDDEPHIFAGTVRANLVLAAPDADDTAVAGALVDAGLGRWLAALPHGLDTELGDGRAVSGGERTRLAIARAILSDRPVLLLDEPVAHLDSPTARAVLADLRIATAGATVIAVSHQAIDELAPDRTLALRPGRGGWLHDPRRGGRRAVSGGALSWGGRHERRTS